MNNTMIILPKWIWDKATNNDDFKVNLSHYMNKNYRGYEVVEVKKHYAICQR